MFREEILEIVRAVLRVESFAGLASGRGVFHYLFELGNFAFDEGFACRLVKGRLLMLARGGELVLVLFRELLQLIETFLE